MSIERPHAGPVQRQLLGRLLLGLLGMTIAVAAVETLLRVRREPRKFAQSDAVVGYVLAPNIATAMPVVEHGASTVVRRTNNLGLRRDQDTEVLKRPGVARILVLGDSQTEGIVNNGETYAALLEARLGRAAGDGRSFEVLNAAVSGYSPLLEYLWLTSRGLRLRPDTILMGIYAGNDVAELLMHEENFGGLGPHFRIASLARADGGWRVIAPGADLNLLGRLDFAAQDVSFAYALIRRRLLPVSDATPQLRDAVTVCAGCLQSLWQASVAGGDPDRLREGFAALEFVVRSTQRVARDAGAKLLIVVIPTKLEVEERVAGVADASRALGLQYDAVAFDRAVRQRIVKTVEGVGLPVVDLLEPLQERFRSRSRTLYWNVDWHLNVDGHAAVAETLLPVVRAVGN